MENEITMSGNDPILYNQSAQESVKEIPKSERKIQSLLKCIDDIPQSDERPKPMDNKKLRSYFKKDII